MPNHSGPLVVCCIGHALATDSSGIQSDKTLQHPHDLVAAPRACLGGPGTSFLRHPHRRAGAAREIVAPGRPDYSGSRAISIRSVGTTCGTTATGRVHRIRARTGSSRITPEASTTPVAGKAIAATSTITIVGTVASSVTNAAMTVVAEHSSTE